MKIVYPDLFPPFIIEEERANALVIENGSLLYKLVRELIDMAGGANGKLVLSHNSEVLSIPKNVEVLSDFVNFEVNTKRLLTKLYSKLESACEKERFSQTVELRAKVSEYIADVLTYFDGELDYSSDFDIKALFKMMNVRLNDDYARLSDKVIEYILSFSELEGERLFVTVNFCDYVSEDELKLFIETLLSHKIKVLFIERHCVEPADMNVMIIDEDYCVI